MWRYLKDYVKEKYKAEEIEGTPALGHTPCIFQTFLVSISNINGETEIQFINRHFINIY